jgi:hypothetical protein
MPAPSGIRIQETSKAKEKYKLFLLEFAALKFRLDKFSDIIWEFPIEIEMNYQALYDHLMNEWQAKCNLCQMER